ncbi:MAG: Holliday junction resolvase RecU [Firmicutes bacterium]|nr:Holliday junction resolvase RecU [Bacillota bacterium]
MKNFYTSGLRGSLLEDLINYTNQVYKKKEIAVIEKIPTPIKPVELDKKKHNISRAYFEKKSSVDYIGVAQGIPICFDAKETRQKSLPLKNIHEHQINFMESFEKQQGISFLIVHFLFNGKYFLLPFKILKQAWLESTYNRKSIPYEKFEYEIILSSNFILDYLSVLNKVQQKNDMPEKN